MRPPQVLPGLLPEPAEEDGVAADLASLFAPKLQSTLTLIVRDVHVALPTEVDLLSAAAHAAAAAAPTTPGTPKTPATPPPPGGPRAISHRVLVGAHSAHMLCTGQSGSASRPCRPTPLNLEADPATPPAAAAGYELRMRTPAEAAASVDGFALSERHALVIELQAEYALPSGATEFVPIAWGVTLPFRSRVALQLGRVEVELGFGASAGPLSGRVPPACGRALLAGTVRCHLELSSSAIWRDLAAEVGGEAGYALRAFGVDEVCRRAGYRSLEQCMWPLLR